MTPEYLKSMSSYGGYSPVGGDQGSYNMSELLKGQESGLSWGDSMIWNGEQTGVGGMVDQFKSPNGGGGGGLFGDTPFLSNQGQQGWGGMALGAAQGLASAYMGMKQYGLAKDTLKFNKDSFSKNFDAQKRTTNASLEDRQRARIASNSSAYESVGSYMNKNGIR